CEGEIALSRIGRIVLFFAAVAACASAQSIDPSFPQSQSSAGRGVDSSSGRAPNVDVVPVPTRNPQISNISPRDDGGLQDQDPQGRRSSRDSDENDFRQTNSRISPRPKPLEPDIEFQEFVTTSLGTGLPIFGQNLFDDVPTTFAPVDRI